MRYPPVTQLIRLFGKLDLYYYLEGQHKNRIEDTFVGLVFTELKSTFGFFQDCVYHLIGSTG